jgi:hypothetical protein
MVSYLSSLGIHCKTTILTIKNVWKCLHEQFEKWPRYCGIEKHENQIKISLGRLNKSDTASENVSELKDELEENSSRKAQRAQMRCDRCG